MLAFAEHHPVLVFGLLVAFSILISVARTFLGLLSGKPARQHGRVVVDYVQKHGYQLLNPVLAQKLDASVLDMVKDPSLHDLARATSDITDVGRFDDGSDDWLAFRCELGARPVTVFNFSQTPPLHSSSGPVPFRVAKIQVDALPGLLRIDGHADRSGLRCLHGRRRAHRHAIPVTRSRCIRAASRPSRPSPSGSPCSA